MRVSSRTLCAVALLVPGLVRCGDNESNGDTGSDATATETTVDETSPDTSPPDSAETTVTSEVVPSDGVAPSYDDPPWTEPAAPARSTVDAAVASIRLAAASRIGTAGLDTLAAATVNQSPAIAAQGYLRDGYFDAARVLLADAAGSATHAGPWVALSAIELLDPAGNSSVAADLARFALSELGTKNPTRITHNRLRASAWNNLGLALLRRDEGAGAVHAYREAVALFPADAAYRTGLAAALAEVDLVLPALVEAQRAVALENLAPDRTPSGTTPARAWKTHLEARLRSGIPMPANAPPPVLPADGPAGDFPATGTSWLGFFVLESSADGSFKTTPPPFEVHGGEHAGGAAISCSQTSESVLDLDCPAQPPGGWFEPALIGPHVEPRVNEEGLSCTNIIARTFSPEVRDLSIDPASDSLASQITGLGREVLNELMAVQASFGVPNGNADTIERCVSYLSVKDAYETAFDVVSDGCSCSCDEEACQTCWETYLEACGTLHEIASGLVTTELSRAQADNVALQQNNERYLAMLVPLTAHSFNQSACDGTCATIVSTSPVLTWIGRIGGRTPELLSHMVTAPTTKYFQCVRAAPTECGGPNEEIAAKQASEVPCLCLGAGLFEVCIQADGTMEVKASAVVAVGAQFNLEQGLSSLRLGVGGDIGLSLGPVAFGVSHMAWWDASTDTWATGDVEWDLGIAGPSGSGIGGGPGLCDAWKEDAPPRESAEDGLAVEVTTEAPPVE